jgi:hypothetical protein
MGSLATRSATVLSVVVLASAGHVGVAAGQSAAGASPPNVADPGSSSTGARPLLAAAPPAAQPTPPPPPPAPPAWSDSASTSLAGTQLIPASSVKSMDGSAKPSTADSAAPSSEDLERRVDSLETRLDAANALLKSYEAELRWLRMIKISGFIQPQLLWQWFNASGSPNATSKGLPSGIGANDVIASPATSATPTTNQDYFRLRRARLKLEVMPVDFVRFVFEVDPTPAGGQIGGVGTIAREMEAEGIARWTDHITTEFGAGIFKIPFGFEVLQSDVDRPFVERSWGERNMTPGEYDTGARAYTTFFDNRLTFQVAVVNGNLEGEKTFSAIPDLNHGKDLVGRLNYNFGPLDAGMSGYYGSGQLVDAATLEFKQYARGAGNVELDFHHVFAKTLGETRVLAEGTIATNMDRGVNYGPGIGLPAIPKSVAMSVTNLQEWSAWARVEQDFTRWATLGLRFDYYTPDDAQANNGRATFAAVGVVHFTRWLQYMLEYDHSVDNVRPIGAAAPGKLIDVLSNVLQARF